MKVKDKNYIEWKKKNDIKVFFKNIKRTHKKKRKHKINNIEKEEFIIPAVFSIINNPESTIAFFNDIIKKIEQIRQIKNIRIIKKKFVFLLNMKQVDTITGDALMYLLTVIRNTRGGKFLPIDWIGNFPERDDIREYLKDSGFLEYMKTDKRNLRKTSEKFQIRNGANYINTSTKKDIRKEIIDYTSTKLGKEVKEINFLFNILTEVMTNIEHAYNNTNDVVFEPAWYIMIDNTEKKMLFTFMDNGLGIPTTIKKKFLEQFLENFNFQEEFRYIISALEGFDKRSQTGQSERNTGLPDVYEKSKTGKIQNLTIISNYAYYNKKKSYDINNNLIGTLFYWEIEKEMI